MTSLKSVRNFVLLGLVLLATTSIWAQSPAPNPPVRAKQAEPSDTTKAEETVDADRVQADKYVAKNIFSPTRSRTETAKILSADPAAATRELTKAKNAQPDPDDWQVSFAPYLYMTGISGTVGARGRVIEVDASFGSVLENLSFGLMGTLEVKKGKFVSFTDMIWTKMSKERNTPGGLFNTAKVDMNLFIFDPEVGYRLYEGKGGSFDVLGGARIWSVENTLNVSTGTLPGFNVSQRKTWVAFVGGFRGVANITPRFFLGTKFDIGAGSGTDITTQFYGGAGFRIRPKAALIGGYRFLKVNHDDNSGFIFNTQMNGFVLGAKFTF